MDIGHQHLKVVCEYSVGFETTPRYSLQAGSTCNLISKHPRPSSTAVDGFRSHRTVHLNCCRQICTHTEIHIIIIIISVIIRYDIYNIIDLSE